MSLRAHLVVRRDAFVLDTELEAEAGEAVVVLGPNGAGKSTLIHALAGLEPLSAGRVVVGGEVWEEPAAGARLPPHRRRAGVAFQDLALFPHLSVLDNVRYGPRARGARREEATGKARALLLELGVGALADRSPRELSGGEARRVALARALATDPSLLLLDEPMSGLDVESAAIVRAALKRALAGFPGVCLLVSHDPLDALSLGQRAVILEGGRVTQAGTAPELARRPRTRYAARLFGKNLLEGTLAESRGATILRWAGLELPVVVEAPLTSGDEALAAVSPRELALRAPADEPGGRALVGRVASAEMSGDAARVRVDGEASLLVEVPASRLADGSLAPGAEVVVELPAAPLVAYGR